MFACCRNIESHYERIRNTEKELSSLQVQLRMNVDPRKKALELLRKKIEEQTIVVNSARDASEAASKAASAAAEVLAGEERIKDQLCQELKLLVDQSARGQGDKLEQLTKRLELLNAGVAPADKGAAQAAAEPTAAADPAAAVPAAVNGGSSGEPAAQQERGGAGVQQNADAAAARARHVQLGRPQSGRQAHAAAPSKPARDTTGKFQGFE